jgi:hypothetical protein
MSSKGKDLTTSGKFSRLLNAMGLCASSIASSCCELKRYQFRFSFAVIDQKKDTLLASSKSLAQNRREFAVSCAHGCSHISSLLRSLGSSPEGACYIHSYK